MPAHPFTLRQVDQARGDLYAIQDDLDFITSSRCSSRGSRPGTLRSGVRRWLGMIGGAVATVTLIEALSRACKLGLRT